MHTKGLLFLNTKNFVVTRFGVDGWSLVLEALPQADRPIADQVVAVGWYDTALLARVYRAVEVALVGRDAAVLEHFSTWTAERDLTTTHRLFLRMANPAYVLEQAGAFWGRYHDWGTWNVVRRDSASASGTLEGFIADLTFCRTLTVYIRRLFELVGAKGVRMVHPRCRGRGDDRCVFDGRWRA